ncbi:MAG: hypothetical protein KBT19_07895 [Lachnospiraceae bacterium]|nr:hypothetical protein [Candidatus Colinaster equi]
MKEVSYRLGHIVRQEVAGLGWLHLIPVDYSIFEYIEVVYEDGTHKFFYENDEGFEHFESNFKSKRFTSYHEFFTTDEPAVEKRGSLQLKYYVRRDTDCYEKVTLASKTAELDELVKAGKIKRVADRVTVYGNYDVEVNDHWDEVVK